jgi:hypothetical protein
MVRADIITNTFRRILPGVELRKTNCSYYHPDNVGVVETYLCNAGMHKALSALDTIRAHLECDLEDGLNATILENVRTIRRRFHTARCSRISFTYNFTQIPFRVNISDTIAEYLDFFRMRCKLNATLELVDVALPVLMHLVENIQCALVSRDSSKPPYFVPPAVSLADAKPPPCLTDGDFACTLEEGTFTKTWFGPFFISVCVALFLILTVLVPLLVVYYEKKRMRIMWDHAKFLHPDDSRVSGKIKAE